MRFKLLLTTADGIEFESEAGGNGVEALPDEESVREWLQHVAADPVSLTATAEDGREWSYSFDEDGKWL